MLRLSLILAILCSASWANAAIVVNTVATVVYTPASVNVSVRLYGGSNTAAIQNVALYRVALDVTSVASSPNLQSPFGASSVVFANPNGTTFTSLWATPGPSGGFGPFTGSPGNIVGNVVTFLGAEGTSFGTNIPITQVAVDAAHLMGTVNFTFNVPAPGSPDQTFTLTPSNGLFQEFVPADPVPFRSNVAFTLNPTTFTITAVPEPSSLVLCMSTAVAAFCFRRRQA
jgi:hypothetical protein